jgi:hypothetical protein
MKNYDKREDKALQGTLGLLVVLIIIIIKGIFL